MKNFQILCYGDSNTWGHIPVTAGRYPHTSRWPGVMAGRLGFRFALIEEGQCGRTTVWDDPLEGDRNGLRYFPACNARQLAVYKGMPWKAYGYWLPRH